MKLEKYILIMNKIFFEYLLLVSRYYIYFYEIRLDTFLLLLSYFTQNIQTQGYPFAKYKNQGGGMPIITNICVHYV